MSQDDELLTVAALFPTAIQWQDGEPRPVTKATDSSDAHDAWELVAGRHWHNEDDEPPKWVSNYGDPKFGWHYLRVPGKLLVSSSLEGDEATDQIPWAPELSFGRDAFVLGYVMPGVDSPGVYDFYVDFEVPESLTPVLKPVGQVELSLTVDSDSQFYDELNQLERFDSNSSEVTFATQNHYGIQYTHREDLGDALETAYDRLKTMYTILSIGVEGIGGAVMQSFRGATLTLRLVAKQTGKRAVINLATNTVVDQASKRLVTPSADELSNETVTNARIVEGTALYATGQRGSVAYSGPAVIVRSSTATEPEKHSLVIAGAGPGDGVSARYEVRAPGTLTPVDGELPAGGDSVPVSKNEADSVVGNTATGTVWAGNDGYHFDGDPASLSVTVVPSEGATVYVDGERRSPEYTHALVIDGTDGGGRAEYEVEVSGGIEPATVQLPVGDEWVGVGLNEPDEVGDSTARGTVVGGRDGYVFSGEIESLTVAPPGEATVYVDGKERPPAYPHSLVISGRDGGAPATYEVSVTDAIRGYNGTLPAGTDTVGVGLNEPDRVGETTARGTVTAGADGYLFAGSISSLSVDPADEATVYVDGEERPVTGGENEPPTATFEFSPDSPSPGEEVTFDASATTDPDGTVSTYEWAFFEPPNRNPIGTPSGETVTWTFGSGTYTVRLTVTDEEGASDTQFHTVTVGNHPPSASFDTNPPDPSVGEAVTFDARSSADPDGSIASYEWEVLPADSPVARPVATATGELFTHRFEGAGMYTVKLTVSDDGGATDRTSRPIAVEGDEGPVATIDGPDGPVSVGQEVTFSGAPSTVPDGRIVQYEWELERDGDSTLFTGETVTHPFSEGGRYTLRLTVLDEDSVSATTSTAVTVVDSPTARFEVRPESPLEPHTDAAFDASPSVDPDGSIVDYRWEFREAPSRDAVTDSGETVTRSFSPGTYAVTLVVTDDDGLSDTASRTVRAIHPPEARFEVAPGSPVPDEVVTLDASDSHAPDGSITGYEWRLSRAEGGDIDTAPVATMTGETVTYSFTDPVTYAVELTVTSDEGLTDAASRMIAVNSPPSAEFDMEPSHPEPGQTVTFDASDSSDPDGSLTRYEWEFRERPIQTPETDAGVSVTRSFPEGEHAVSLTVTDDRGASATTSKTLHVEVAEHPIRAEIDATTGRVYVGQTIEMDGRESRDPDDSIVDYAWTIDVPGEGTVSRSGPTATYEVAAVGTHRINLTVTNERGDSDTTSVEFTAREQPDFPLEDS